MFKTLIMSLTAREFYEKKKGNVNPTHPVTMDYEDLFLLMEEYKSQAGGLRFVKASEEKPKENWTGIVRWTDDAAYAIFQDGKFYDHNIYSSGLPFNNQKDIEWLSSESDAGEVEKRKELKAFIKWYSKINDERYLNNTVNMYLKESQLSSTGTGKEEIGEWQLCPKCNGSGKMPNPFPMTTGGNLDVQCDVCCGVKVLAKPKSK